jgi:hypothetical protein
LDPLAPVVASLDALGGVEAAGALLAAVEAPMPEAAVALFAPAHQSRLARSRGVAAI